MISSPSSSPAPAPATAPVQALALACESVGLDPTGAELIRLAENALYRLPGHIVVRISRPGQLTTAHREVAVSTWLQQQGFPVVRALTDLRHPVEAAGRAVTFWHELPAHAPAGPGDIGALLHRLHTMPVPDPGDLALPATDPFVQVEQRIATLTFLEPADRRWLLDRAAHLRRQYGQRPTGTRTGLVHGDPWSGNVVRTSEGPVLLDLERFSLGPPEYDLVVIAAGYTSYGLLPAEDYLAFADAYGRDVTTWSDYPLLRDIRELRVTTYAGQVALDHDHARAQALHRLRCLQQEHGHRPWPGWHPVP